MPRDAIPVLALRILRATEGMVHENLLYRQIPDPHFIFCRMKAARPVNIFGVHNSVESVRSWPVVRMMLEAQACEYQGRVLIGLAHASTASMRIVGSMT